MSENIEIWKPVVGYEGFYECSNFGRVRSLDRDDGRGWWIKGRILKPDILKKWWFKGDTLQSNKKNKIFGTSSCRKNIYT